jgi:DNA-binding transcriptional MocR family regulator
VAICDKISDEPGHEYFWGSQQYLAQKLNIGDRQVRNHMKTLEKLGYIRREKRTTSSGTYTTDAIYVDTSGRKLPLEEKCQNQRKKTSDNTLEDPLATLEGSAKRKSSLPENFPDEEALERAQAFWTKQSRNDLNPEHQAAIFRSNAEAKDLKFVSWPGAWATWYQRAVTFGAVPQQANQLSVLEEMKQQYEKEDAHG